MAERIKSRNRSRAVRDAGVAMLSGWLRRFRRWTAYLARAIQRFFQSLEIKFKLSIVIVSIVVVVVFIFSATVLYYQRDMLEETVELNGRMSAVLLAENVEDILLCKITKVCEPDGSVQEQLQRLITAEIEFLDFAFVLDTDGELNVIPDSARIEIEANRDTYTALIQETEYRSENRGRFIEYYHPVRMPVEGQEKPVALGVVGIGFKNDAILAPINRSKTVIYTSAALVIIISVAGIYLLAARLLVTRIMDLGRAAREVGLGNLEVSVETTSKDELGQLAREFNRMVNHLREKLQMQKFVSKLTVQMIRERSGSRLAPAEGERHDVAILFSDIRNFTGIAERLEPEQIVRLINIYFQLQTETIERNGGVVDKFMGDQIMAIFPTRNMLGNAIAAAVSIQREIRRINDVRTAHGEVILNVGVGINHGPAVLGNMGSKHRMDYTVIGDVVNIAARLCSIAKSGQIIAALGAVRSVNGQYPTNRLQPIIVRGRSRPIDICEIDYDRDLI